MHIEEFRDKLRQIATIMEDVWIEKEGYRDFILLTGALTETNLESLKASFLADAQTRKGAHEHFAEMWKGLGEVGTAAFGEGLLIDLPPNDKPN